MLIVDDEPVLCDTLKDIFDEKGDVVHVAHDALSAMRLIEAREFDLGLFDIQLPDVDGLSVLDHFKRWHPDAVSIVITGHASMQNVMHAIQNGADGYFLKPVNIDEMLLAIQNAMEKQGLQRAIRESEALYRIITEASSDLIMVVTGPETVEYVNAGALRKHLGREPRDLVGHAITTLVHADDAGSIQRAISSCLASCAVEVECRMVDARDGAEKWFDVKARQFVDKDATKKCLLTCNEMTGRKRYEALLKEENLRLKEIAEMEQAFVSNATHELRTPLFVIHGSLHFLLDHFQNELSPPVHRLAALGARGATRLRGLVETLVDFSDAREGGIELRLERDDLARLVRHVVEELRTTGALEGISVATSLPVELPCWMDPGRIQRVVEQLASNAIKNVQPGGHVDVTGWMDDGFVVCSIHDDGIGLTSEEMRLAFKKFGKQYNRNVSAHVNIQGIGLGLHLAKEVVEKHGGRIWLESSGRGRGCTATFTIPCQPGPLRVVLPDNDPTTPSRIQGGRVPSVG